MKKYISKKSKILITLLLTVSLAAAVIPFFNVNTKANGLMLLGTDYVIDGLSQADAIVAVAEAQNGKTGMDLGAIEGWCADFIYSCAAAAGIGSDIIPYTGDPMYMFNGIIANGGTIVTDEVQAGDIVYYPNMGGNGHIGLVTGPDTVISGNTGSTDYFLSYVYERYFSLDEDAIVVRPAYSADVVTDSDAYSSIGSLPYSGVADTFYFDRYMPQEDEQFAASGLGWYIDDFNVLTIYGSGSMGSDNNISTYPWNDQRNDIVKVVIEDGVTDIGPYAFAACSNLISISIPGSVSTIYENAFDNCMSLLSVRYTDEEYLYRQISIIEAGNIVITVNTTDENGTEHEETVDVTPGNIFSDTNVYFNSESDHVHDYVTTNTWTGFESGLKYERCSVCGDVSAVRIPASLNWSFENGILTISGSGDIPDMAAENVPWNDIKDSIQTVQINKGIRLIGANVFSGLSNLENVNIFSELTQIGAGNFENASGKLKVITTMSEDSYNGISVDASDVSFINAVTLFHTLSDQMEMENVVEPTCTSEGSYDLVMYCADCGRKLYSQHCITNRTEHTWGSRTVVKKALEYEEGEVTYTCSQCGEVKSVPIQTKTINDAEDGLMSTPMADGNYYYIENNRVSSYTGFAENQNGIWYVIDGKVDFEFKGLVVYQDVWRYISSGTFDDTYTGLAYNDYGWWYVKDGTVDFTYTGVASYTDGLWLVKDGKVVFDYNGIGIYNGAAVKIVNGQLQQ